VWNDGDDVVNASQWKLLLLLIAFGTTMDSIITTSKTKRGGTFILFRGSIGSCLSFVIDYNEKYRFSNIFSYILMLVSSQILYVTKFAISYYI